MDTESLVRKISELKKEKNAIILCHNYQRPEIYEVADFIGDSLDLSLKAKGASAKIIVFCGVDFMAESAKILNPRKKVLHPDTEARCPMAAMVSAGAISKKRKEFPGAAVVSYINTSAATKAESDICCTSANFLKVAESLHSQEIIFAPDYNMGKYLQQEMKRTKTKKRIIPWHGFCYVHDFITPDEIRKLKKAHPKAEVLVHPESPADVIKLADHVLGTGGMLKRAKSSKASEFIIATEEGMCNRLRREIPGKEFYPAGGTCQNMKRITLEKVYECLKGEKNQVKVPEKVAAKARKALERMLEMK
jgi:quinolinate synthase